MYHSDLTQDLTKQWLMLVNELISLRSKGKYSLLAAQEGTDSDTDTVEIKA
jgi:hypothetical protein